MIRARRYILLAVAVTLLAVGFQLREPAPARFASQVLEVAADSLVRDSVPQDSVAKDSLTRDSIQPKSAKGSPVEEALQAPDMPETQAFVPTMMSELEAANPLAGLTLMQPPTANQSGTANLTYPIEIPAGRRGMQPSLALTYSSGGGQGWLGVGWDIPIPCVTVETRWGVPRYDAENESEVYLLNGEQLLRQDADGSFLPMPHRTNQWQSRQTGPVRFFPRVDEAHDSIIRHGDTPSDYWWEVVDRNGVTHTYGHDAPGHPATLRTDANQIAKWMLTESRDPYGNSVRYYYEVVSSHYVEGGTNQGKAIYLSHITYTNTSTEEGRYRVDFNRRNRLRDDVDVNCRYGFPEVGSELLCNIEVTYDGHFVRMYQLITENNDQSLYKTRLKQIVKIDSLDWTNIPIEGAAGYLCVLDDIDASTLNKFCKDYEIHAFRYQDEPEHVFSSPVTFRLDNEDIGNFFLTHLGKEESTALGGTRGYGFNMGGGAAIGAGFNVFWTDKSAGASYNYSHNRNRGKMTLMDIDGDGYADKVFRLGSGDTLLYRKQLHYADDSIGWGQPQRIEGLEDVKDFLDERSNTHTIGLNAALGISLSASSSFSTSRTKTYFTDVNGDGLPDLMTPKHIYFNNTDAEGTVRFIASANKEADTVRTALMPCYGYMIHDGRINDSIFCRTEKEVDSLFADLIEQESVAQTLQARGFTIDSVVQRPNGMVGVWGHRYLIHCDEAPSREEAEAAFLNTEAVKVWVAPKAGIIQLQDTLRVRPDTTGGLAAMRDVDGVTFRIQHDSGIGSDRMAGHTCELLRKSKASRDTALFDTTLALSVQAGDILYFRLQSGKSHDYDHVDWKHVIRYTGETERYDSERDFVLTGDEYFQAPEDGMLRIDIATKTGAFAGTATLKVLKNANTLIQSCVLHPNREVSLPINPYHLSQCDSIRVVVEGTPQTQWPLIRCVPHYRFIADDLSHLPDTLHYYLPARLRLNSSSADPYYRKLFGPMYKGWGQFTHHTDQPESPIDLHSLAAMEPPAGGMDTVALGASVRNLDASTISLDALGGAISDNGLYNPHDESSYWYPMRPDCQRWLYEGYGGTTSVAARRMSNTHRLEGRVDSRIEEVVEYDSPLMGDAVEDSATRRLARTYRTFSLTGSSSLNFTPLTNIVYTESYGWTRTLSDYMDLNGDRYPDIIGMGGVQYTQPHGGLGGSVLTEACALRNDNYSHGLGLGGSSSNPGPFIGEVSNKANTSDKLTGSFNISGDITMGGDRNRNAWVDINGDGLPDRVYPDGRVALNTGYGFLSEQDWHGGTHLSSSFMSFGVNGGLGVGKSFNLCNLSIGGGLGAAWSDSQTDTMMCDINGDGLPDRLYWTTQGVFVRYNKGYGKWDTPTSLHIPSVSQGSNCSESANLAVTVGIPLALCKITFTVSGAPYSQSLSRDKAQLVDFNNDGLPDYVTSDSATQLTVRYNQMGGVNLLREVVQPTGSRILLDYALTESSTRCPQRHRVLSDVRIVTPSPVAPDTLHTSFRYKNPYYDRYERTDYGFAHIETHQHDTQGGDTVYRTQVQQFHNDAYSLRGKLRREALLADTSRLISETCYDVALFDTEHETFVEGDCPDGFVPLVKGEVRRYYEQNATPQLTTAVSYDYDAYCNVTHYRDWGDTAHSHDDLVMDITYCHSREYNLIGLKSEVRVTAPGGALLRRQVYMYNDKGSITEMWAYNGNTISKYNLSYDAYGNLASARQPLNHQGQRMAYYYTYDSHVHTYLTGVSDVFGRHTSTTYDLKRGLPLLKQDAAGSRVRYTYDPRGRLTSVTCEKEWNAGSPTLWMEYHPEATVPYAQTFHYDVQHPLTPIRTVIFTDGLGRVVQSKKSAVVHGADRAVVSGRVMQDAFGRAILEYQPEDEPLSQLLVYTPGLCIDTAVATRYDHFDRQVEVRLPGGIVTRYAYGISPDSRGRKSFLTAVTDPLLNTTLTLQDPFGKQVEVVDALGQITWFEYDRMHQLVASTDPEGVSTSYAYDMLGRLVMRDHPDAGTTYLSYDPAGNAVQTITGAGDVIRTTYDYNRPVAIHYPRFPGNDVTYTYDAAGRKTEIQDGSGRQRLSYDELGNVSEQVRTFAIPNAPNTYTFRMLFEYDSWNRMQSITYPDGEIVGYKYDKGGNLESVAGEKNGEHFPYVDNISYNKYGQRSAIHWGNGTKASYTYDNLQRLSHLSSSDGQGNPMQEIEYTFDAVSNITRADNTAPSLGILGGQYTNKYTYDNIYRLTNATQSYGRQNYLEMSYSPNGRVLAKDQTHTRQKLLYAYCPDYQPHAIRRILNTWNDTLLDLQWDMNGNLTQVNTYTDQQYYDHSRFLFWTEDNRLSAVVDPYHFSYYGYDYAGERTLKLTGDCSLLDINAESMSVAAHLDRVTLYASPYLIATEHGYTKHIYAGTERVCAKIGSGGFDDAHALLGADNHLLENAKGLFAAVLDETGVPYDDFHCNGSDDGLMGLQLEPHAIHVKASVEANPARFATTMINLRTTPVATTDSDFGPTQVVSEPDRYFYHPDHLGSASWITDAKGTPVQHIQYCPYGEPFVNQQRPGTIYNERFTFTGKERDEETGYHYFGARYLDAAWMTGWLSVDPMSDKYPSLSPYNYCAWNSIKLVDPNGMQIDIPPANLKYIIQKGDNFWNLENEWELPHGTLQSINPNIDPTRLQVGQEINAARMEGQLLIVGDNVSIPQGRELQTPNGEGSWESMTMASCEDFTLFRMAFEALLPSMGSFLPSNSFRALQRKSNVDRILERACNGRGNFGVGRGTYAEAMEAGKKWVGENYTTSSRDKNILISQDRKRQFRPPSYKPKLGKYQANFQSRENSKGKFVNNGHMTIDE